MTDQGTDRQVENRGGMGQFILKALIAGVIIVAGVAGGIYTGTAMNRSTIQAPDQLHNNTFLEIGDAFPNYALWDVKKEAEYHVSDIVADGPALLLFVSHHCSACHLMLKQWDKHVLPELNSDLKLYLVYDENEGETDADSSFVPDVPNVISVTTDREDQRGDDGIIATPTLVAVGRDGKVKFISTGYVRDIDADYIAKHL